MMHARVYRAGKERLQASGGGSGSGWSGGAASSRYLREWAAFEKRAGDLEVRPTTRLPCRITRPLWIASTASTWSCTSARCLDYCQKRPMSQAGNRSIQVPVVPFLLRNDFMNQS